MRARTSYKTPGGQMALTGTTVQEQVIKTNQLRNIKNELHELKTK